MQGLFLKTVAQMSQFTPVAVRVSAPDDAAFELHGEVVQVVPGQGVAVQFGAEAQESIQRLKAACEAKHSDEPEGDTDDPLVLAPGETAEATKTRKPAFIAEAENVQKQVAEMSVAEKRRAALHGRKNLRMMLIRDRNKTIHPFVIQNPAITLDEVEQIAKMPSVNPDVLRTIAKSREWTRSAAVCRNLVRNPKTPMKEALLVLNKLPVSDVRALAKSSNVRAAIQQAARKKVIQ
jgi:hypothetical protein